MTTIEAITQLIKEREKTFEISTDNIISQFRGDLQYTKDYNGRQILELLQNADDAGSDIFEVEVDTRSKILRVSNNGVAFNTNGIKSLMIPNLSEKNKKEFIGNKGLGFRSILNWAESVQIFSGDINVEFSPELARQNFERLVPDAGVRAQLQSQRDLPEGVVPFPVLAIPKLIAPEVKDGLATTISIKYVSAVEDSIQTQIDALRNHPEAMLFLNHINTIRLIIDGHETLLDCIDGPAGKYPTKTIGHRKWHIADTGDKLLAAGKTHYRLKVAWQDDLSDNFGKLFTFLPTSVSLHLPYLVHGTFELEANRKHITDSEENKYILTQLTQLIKKVAEDLCLEKTDWRPWRVLTPISDITDSPALIAFYQKLEQIKKSLTVYPRINGGFATSNEAKFYKNEFSEWLLRNDATDVLPSVILPCDKWELVKKELTDPYFGKQIFVRAINEIGRSELAISERASLIVMLAESDKFPFSAEGLYDILIDRNGKVIPNSVKAYTIVTGNKGDFPIPEFASIRIINEELYHEIARITKLKSTVARDIKDLLTNIVNINSYEPFTVWEALLSQVNKYFENGTVPDSPKFADWMRCLFEIWQLLGPSLQNNNEWPESQQSIKLLNSGGTIKDSSDLLLGKYYSGGKLAEKLYGNKISDHVYVASPTELSLSESEHQDVEEFLKWCGVAPSIRVTRSWDWDDDYTSFVLNEIDHPQHFHESKLHEQLTHRVTDFDILSKLPVTSQLILILNDQFVRKQLSENHSDVTTWSFHNVKELSGISSYIKFQFTQRGAFSLLVLGDYGSKLNTIINGIESVDYSLLKTYGFDKTAVDEYLHKLGAKPSFESLTPERVYDLLRSLETNDENGESTQQFYKLALNHLEKIPYSPSQSDIEGLRVFARKGNDRRWLPAKDAFYSNDTILPESIVSTKYIVNVPKRFGEDKVTTYLGVQNFKSYKLVVDKNSISSHPSARSLADELREITPSILAARVRELKEEASKKSAASLLKSFDIILVKTGSYQCNDEPARFFRANEFINEGNTYYLCADEAKSLPQLKSDSLFCDAFSEIICLVTKVWEQREEFRRIFVGGKFDAEHCLNRLGEDGYLAQAKELLGISPSHIQFWNIIFGLLLRNSIPDIISDYSDLGDILLSFLGYELPEYYSKVDIEKLDDENSYNFLQSIVNTLGLSLWDIKSKSPEFPALQNYHIKMFEKCSTDVEILFNGGLLWSLQEKGTELQLQFESIRSSFKLISFQIVRELAKGFACDFKLEYSKVLTDKIEKHFKISFAEVPIGIKVQSLYPDLEIADYSYTDADASRFYFSGNEEYLKALKSKILNEDQSTDSLGHSNSNLEGVLKIATLVDLKLPALSIDNTRPGTAKTYDGQKEKRQKKAGKTAETIVRDTLVKEFGRSNVIWLSGNSNEEYVKKDDTVGYDMKYRMTGDGEWFFLEVKSYSANSFIISANEVREALIKKEKYHLALVKGNEVNLITDFFNDVDRLDNFKHVQESGSVRSLNFEVYFSLPNGSENSLENEVVLNEEIVIA